MLVGITSSPLFSELKALGLSASAEVSERLAPRLGMKVKAPTLLRYLRTIPPPSDAPVRVLGLDDFALRRGDCYGTILVNIETGKPLGLLPDRTAEAVLPWLLRHPEIDVVSRDRASAYADAIKRALPHATQVADRYHLVQNLREHLQRWLDHKRTCLPFVEETPIKGVLTNGTDSSGSPGDRSREEVLGVSQINEKAEGFPELLGAVQKDLISEQEKTGVELSYLTYAERKKKISRDKRYARVRAGHGFVPSGNGATGYRSRASDEQTHCPAFYHRANLPGTHSWLWAASQGKEQGSPISCLPT